MSGTRLVAFVRRNAIALVALFVALGGVAYAGSLAPNNSVDSSAIVNGQVKSKDAKDDGLKGKDVRDASLAMEDLGPIVTGSFNLGSVAAGSCVNSQQNFVLGGADDDDMWLVTPTGTGVPESNYDNNGELIMLGIPHGGEGHIKVCNVSSGAIDPGSVSFKAVLING